jgi:CyaY protein
MDDAMFDKQAAEELKQIDRALGAVEGIEVDSTGDVITIEFEDGARYILNSHRAARQIWFAAELAAAHYSRNDAGAWIDTRGGGELWARIAQVLSNKLERDVKLR